MRIGLPIRIFFVSYILKQKKSPAEAELSM